MAGKRTTPKATKAPSARKGAGRRWQTVTQEEIAARAYFLHLEGGRDPLENGLRAERELVGA